jgi:hypothetical protein
LSIAFSQDIPPELFQYNQSTFQAFYFFKNVMIDSNLVEPEDWVGTFNCAKWDADSTACEKLGPCVGSRKWNTAKCGSGVCDLPAMGDAADGNPEILGYLQSGNYPVYLIYDNSAGVYYKTIPSGDVKQQSDLCRNGYPFCYAWNNFGFYFVENLTSKEIYLDCKGQIGGTKILDDCGICGGSGPQFTCESSGKSYCTEYQYQQECKSD